MFGTYTLGRILGVPVRVQGLVLVLLAVLLMAGGLQGQPVVIPLGSLVVALLAHELGHAVVARRLGVHVFDIVLWPLGGMARMAEVPERAGVEARIAAAGPLVNLALAGLGVLALGAFAPGSAVAFPVIGDRPGAAQALQVFVLMNLLLGIGNLVPAFPMDGGRLLRAGLVASGRDWVGATESAVRVGRWLAVGMIVLGIFHSLVLVLVGLFVLVMGSRELWTVRLRHAAGSLFGPPPGADPQGPRPAGAGPFGPLEPEDVDPLAPPLGPSPGDDPRSGFTEEEIRRLEAYRGRLRRGGDDS